MKDALILEGKTYISARRAAEVTGYTSDYIGQLCRGGKLECKMVGRSWFVLEQSILNHSYLNSDSTKAPKATESVIEEVEETPKPVEPVPVKKAPNVSPVIHPANDTLPVRFVPSQFSMQKFELAKNASQNNLRAKISGYRFQSVDAGAITAHAEEKMVLAFIVIAFGLSGFFLETSLGVFNSHSGREQAASVATISKDIALSAVRGFQTAVTSMSHALGFISKTNFLAQSGASLLPAETNYGKIAVTPSAGSVSGDEVIKQKIRNSFSDEVAINPDTTGSSGVIVPVFKKATKESFVYVLVPLQDNPKQ